MPTPASFLGFSVTAPMGVQLRVWRDQRAGFRARASAFDGLPNTEGCNDPLIFCSSHNFERAMT